MPWIFSKMCEFEEIDSKTFFQKLTKQFIKKRFGNLWQLAINKIHETQKTILWNSK
jgi:hypothetical protein